MERISREEEGPFAVEELSIKGSWRRRRLELLQWHAGTHSLALDGRAEGGSNACPLALPDSHVASSADDWKAIHLSTQEREADKVQNWNAVQSEAFGGPEKRAVRGVRFIGSDTPNGLPDARSLSLFPHGRTETTALSHGGITGSVR